MGRDSGSRGGIQNKIGSGKGEGILSLLKTGLLLAGGGEEYKQDWQRKGGKLFCSNWLSFYIYPLPLSHRVIAHLILACRA